LTRIHSPNAQVFFPRCAGVISGSQGERSSAFCRSGSAASRELWLLAILFGADQTHQVNRLSSRFLRVSLPLDEELTLAEVTCLAIENVEEIFLQGFAPRPGLG
jgi:hypothetical protein